MTNIIDPKDIKAEVVYWLRNSDIFTVTQRSVTTATATGTFASASTYSIAVTNIKNIRSIVVDSTTLTYGTDYTYDTDFLDTTIKTKITFTAAQTGAYTITYDYGSDKIFPDFPRADLTIDSFPRIGFDIINMPSTPGGFGNVNITEVNISIIVYGLDTDDIQDWIKTIRTNLITDQLNFYNLFVVRPTLVGPAIKSPTELGRDKVFQQNIDFIGEWNYEIN